jgi:hypothetical protein
VWLGGITLDQSNTGVTLYVEPEEAIALNNRETELAGREADEEARILKQLSTQVGWRARTASFPTIFAIQSMYSGAPCKRVSNMSSMDRTCC